MESKATKLENLVPVIVSRINKESLSGGPWWEGESIPYMAECCEHAAQEARTKIKNGAWWKTW